LLDFEDYLRQRGLRQWKKDDPEALKVRSDRSDQSDWSNKSDEEFANILICLINQASYLLWRQMQRLEENFLKEGGFTERMYNARKKARGR
jgi:restriction system protein